MAYKPFKMKGSPMKRNFGVGSPNNLNNFGIGPGGSPWKNEDDDEDVDGDEETTSDKDKEKDKVDEQGGDAEKADKPWVKALKIGTTLLSGGIQGVYGGTRQYPKINYGKKASVNDPIENISEESGESMSLLEYDDLGKQIYPDDPKHSQYEEQKELFGENKENNDE